MIRTLFWKMYYQWQFKEDYEARIHRAKTLVRRMKEAKRPRLTHFYDVHGERIRGWHKREAGFNTIRSNGE